MRIKLVHRVIAKLLLRGANSIQNAVLRVEILKCRNATLHFLRPAGRPTAARERQPTLIGAGQERPRASRDPLGQFSASGTQAPRKRGAAAFRVNYYSTPVALRLPLFVNRTIEAVGGWAESALVEIHRLALWSLSELDISIKALASCSSDDDQPRWPGRIALLPSCWWWSPPRWTGPRKPLLAFVATDSAADRRDTRIPFWR